MLCISLYIISVYLFGCPIITQEPLDPIGLKFYWGTLVEMFLAWFEKLF